MKKSHLKVQLQLDRLLSKSMIRQLAVLAVVLLGVLCLSYLFLAFSGSDWKAYCKANDLSMWLLPLYLLIDSNALNNLYINGHVHGWMLFASSLTFLFGVFVFNGVIIGIITNSIERRVRNHEEGHIHYLKSGHYIIMGYDDMVQSIIIHIFEKDPKAFVLLMSAAETPYIKEKLKKTFNEKQLEHIIINYGHRMSKDYYKDIHLESSEQIYIVGLRSLPTHDAINVECVDSICRYLSESGNKEHPKRITGVFEDLDTYAAFKTSEIFSKVNNLGIEFIPYNFYAGWAKQVFVKREYKDFDNPEQDPYKYPCVYGKGITPNDDKYVHLVFVGTTNFAVAFAMEAAHVLHFPNAYKGKKTLITFIDKNADKEKDEFITRSRHFFEIQEYTYKDLSDEPKVIPEEIGKEYLCFKGDNANFLDVEFEFIKGDIFSKKVQDEIAKWSGEHNKKQYLSIFLAMTDQRQNFVMGMNMPDGVYDNEVPLFIRQDRSDNFVTNLRNTDKKDEKDKFKYSTVNKDGKLEKEKRDARYANIYPFGMNETAFSADEHSLKCAKLINYLYSTANYDTHKFQGILALDAMSEVRIWEEAERYWKFLSVALKWSNLYCAYTIRTKLATLRVMRGLDIDDDSHDYQTLSDYEVEEMAKVEHNRWNVEKLLMGYRKAREKEDLFVHPEFASDLTKNKKLFIHHNIRPYNQLDIIKEHDREISRYIPWIMKMTENNQLSF